tara:strand:+ start:306 stop:1403 length:1098 start_codon:yes stop_codon:yes gene_type:complete
MIQQFDLKKEYAFLENEIQSELKTVFTKTNFIGGENVKLIESNIANYIGVKYAISCNSGTDALHFALRALGIRKGDEVITTPFTFISTLEAIIYVGAKPVFADIDLNTYNISEEQILKKITKNTKAILPVHLFGNPVNVEILKKSINNNSIKIVEDCAQSFGSGINHQRTGSIGDMGCFSFYPTKNLGCYGDGGMVTTNSEELFNMIIKLRNHGSSKRYHHDIIGYNSRLDEIQAAILNVKIKHIDRFNLMRQKIADVYNDNLSNLDFLTIPKVIKNGNHVFHQYTINSRIREKIKIELEKNNIGSAIYYPISLEKQDAYKNIYNEHGVFVNSNYLSNTCLSLPIHPFLSEKDALKVCNVIQNIS